MPCINAGGTNRFVVAVQVSQVRVREHHERDVRGDGHVQERPEGAVEAQVRDLPRRHASIAVQQLVEVEVQVENVGRPCHRKS